MSRRFFVLTALVALLLAGSAGAAPTETPTPTPTPSDGLDAGDVLERVNTVNATEAGTDTARDVAAWAGDPRHLAALNTSQAREVVGWLRTVAREPNVNVSVPSALVQLATTPTGTPTPTATISPTPTASATPTPTASPTATPAPTPTATPGRSSSANLSNPKPIGPVTAVTEWTYNEGTATMRIRVKAEVPTRLTMSAAPDVSRGVGRFNIKRLTLSPGTKWVSIHVEESDSAAVVFFSTPQCINAGSCGFISTAARGPGNPLRNSNPTWGWIGGSLIGVASLVAAGVWTVRTEGGTPEVA